MKNLLQFCFCSLIKQCTSNIHYASLWAFLHAITLYKFVRKFSFIQWILVRPLAETSTLIIFVIIDVMTPEEEAILSTTAFVGRHLAAFNKGHVTPFWQSWRRQLKRSHLSLITLYGYISFKLKDWLAWSTLNTFKKS